MGRSWKRRFGTVAAVLTLALSSLVAGPMSHPRPATAAYCDDFPFLCSTLTVTPQGNGAGTITTADGFISCQWSSGVQSGTCSKRYIEDGDGHVNVQITYQAAASSYVCVAQICDSTTWTEDIVFGADSQRKGTFSVRNCASVADAWCARLTIEVKGAGKGTVKTGDGRIDCARNGGVTSGTCSYDYWIGPEGGFTPQIGVNATAAAGSEVCEDSECGSTRSFATAFSSDSSFTFSFALLNYGLTVSKTGTGSGRVIGSAGGIDCGSTCTATFHYDDHLTLAAVANADSSFQGWAGACAGQGASCELTIKGTATTTAMFASSPGATSGTVPTPGPNPTARPTPTAGPGSSIAPGSSVPGAGGSPGATAPSDSPVSSTDPGASPGESMDGAPSESGGIGSPGGAAGQPTIEPTVPAAGGSSGDSMLLAVAILAGAVVIAIGLAVGLRGRRAGTREDEPAA